MNTYLNDKSISLKAKGLLSTALEAQKDKDYLPITLAELFMLSNNGIVASRNALQELKTMGYVKRGKVPCEHGFSRVVWNFVAEKKL